MKKYIRKISALNWIVYLALAFLTFASPSIMEAYLNQAPSESVSYFNFYWSMISMYVACLFALCMMASLFYQKKQYKIFDNTQTLEHLKSLSWQEFEELTAQIMRHLHYRVEKSGGARADGGIDLVVYKKNFKYIVQCKHWKSTSVGVKIVREMMGVSMHERAAGVYIFTCGNFTKEAREFAKEKRMYLINGYQICKLIQNIKDKAS